MSATPTKEEREVARLIVVGDGTPRSRDQLVDTVARALAAARAGGAVEGARGARLRVLSEAKAIAEGERNAAEARIRVLQRELDAL